MSKAIWKFFPYALVRSLIDLLNIPHTKPNPINCDLLTRIIPRLAPSRVFASRSHWFVVLFIFVKIGQCDSFGRGFARLKTALSQSRINNLGLYKAKYKRIIMFR